MKFIKQFYKDNLNVKVYENRTVMGKEAALICSKIIKKLNN